MSFNLSPKISHFRLTVRTYQGYRYLDRCGEAMIQLEESLEEHWAPTEMSPKGGNLKNPALGMVANFSTDYIQIEQDEFISFEHFMDQSCKICAILCQVFGVKRIITPGFEVILQVPVKNTEEAERYIAKARIVEFNKSLAYAMEGEPKASRIIQIVEQKSEEAGVEANRRRRLEVQSVIQTKQPDFDHRLTQRVNLVPGVHREYLTALMKLREKHVSASTHSVQISLENSLEGEFDVKAFELPVFQSNTIAWAEDISKWFELAVKDLT